MKENLLNEWKVAKELERDAQTAYRQFLEQQKKETQQEIDAFIRLISGEPAENVSSSVLYLGRGRNDDHGKKLKQILLEIIEESSVNGLTYKEIEGHAKVVAHYHSVGMNHVPLQYGCLNKLADTKKIKKIEKRYYSKAALNTLIAVGTPEAVRTE